MFVFSTISVTSIFVPFLLMISAVKVASGFNFGPHPHERHLTICSICPPGTGILHLCNETHDTVCQACQTGHTFSSGGNVDCQPCSLCGPGLFVDKKCTALQDVTCDACQNKRSPFSMEYLSSCKWDSRARDVLQEVVDDESKDNTVPSEQDTNLQILQEELQLRNELSALKSKVDDEALVIKELGSAFNRAIEEQKPSSQSAFKRSQSKDSYETNPKTILAVVVLTSFGLLSLGTAAVVWMILTWTRRRKKLKAYGGAKTSHDGITLLQIEADSFDENAPI